MISRPYQYLVCISRIFLLVGVYAALPHRESAKFSFSSILDAALPRIHPIVAAGSNRCEAFKSFFGLTYEQMQEKNASVHETLNIDLITKNGNVKFNLTATKRLGRVMKNAKTIIILIHGFLESSDGWMVSGLAPVLLNRTGLKLFALDGRKIINWEYFRSSTYARFMGEQLGTSLSKIIKGMFS
ncbi:hypothetical protein O3G_MSEX014943 [Manduca sexta]|uniref:Uncharacterized protein n=1 Tax=Manduca sexta TaxID=7130 RepID=A0A922D368_MANSE|nr:hypothetical protein O3G_MSEX014943 [Manduca sexta]